MYEVKIVEVYNVVNVMCNTFHKRLRSVRLNESIIVTVNIDQAAIDEVPPQKASLAGHLRCLRASKIWKSYAWRSTTATKT